jgi:hypothetical protein
MVQEEIIARETIEQKIFLIRGQKVMLDKDLAELYGIETRVVKQAVKRNIKRFPVDFMFEPTEEELEILRSQIVISSWGGIRYAPMVFTEQGVAMLSSVLKSDRAIQVNIQIMRVFTRLRQMLVTHKELAQKLEEHEQIIAQHDGEIATIFEAIHQLMAPPEPPAKEIGFKLKEPRPAYCVGN